MNKIAIYDFCQTLVDFESGDAFIHYIRSKEGTPYMLRMERLRKTMIRTKIMFIMERILKLIHKNGSLNKRMVLLELKGMEREKIDAYAELYYENVIKRHFITEVLNHLRGQQEQRYQIVIVSASYDPFLKLFAREYKIDDLITNEYRYDKEEKFTGRLCREDCIGENKVRRFMEKYPDFDVNGYDDSVSYGDSRSDLSILKLTGKGVVISRGKSKEWASANGLEEFIW